MEQRSERLDRDLGHSKATSTLASTPASTPTAEFSTCVPEIRSLLTQGPRFWPVPLADQVGAFIKGTRHTSHFRWVLTHLQAQGEPEKMKGASNPNLETHPMLGGRSGGDKRSWKIYTRLPL